MDEQAAGDVARPHHRLYKELLINLPYPSQASSHSAPLGGFYKPGGICGNQ